MAWNFIFPISIVTLLCLMGFLKKPPGIHDLLRPRFIVPGLFWMGTVNQIIWHGEDNQGSMYYYCRANHGMQALWFLAACMFFFWMGYALPMGRKLANPLMKFQITYPINMTKIRRVGYLLSILNISMALALVGPRMLGFKLGWDLFMDRNSIWSMLSMLLMVLSSCCIGLGWPRKWERNILNVTACLFFLFLTSAPSMSSFSRGSGLSAIIAFGMYCIAAKRFPKLMGIFAIYWFMICAVNGLHGRAVYGHSGGLFLYVKHLFEYSFVNFENYYEVLTSGANDAFTPTSLAIYGYSNVDMHPLPPLEWILFQIPVPHLFDFQRHYDFQLTYILGGVGNWGYTSSMFGDLYGHFGFKGSVWMIMPGVCYRFVEEFCFRRNQEQLATFSISILFGLISYNAFIQALFNSYRGWVTAFFVPLYIIIFVMVLQRLFFAAPSYVNYQTFEPVSDET